MRLLILGSVLAATAAPAVADMATEAAPYHSPMRNTCEDELKKDADWQKILRDRLRDDVHQEDADLMLRNETHVQYAYAAIWVLVVVFLGFLYVRQRGLRAEIVRLERELAEAKKS
ncbi:MAG TPA: CcmD family protein [Kofleriaceae bacterium]|nr:CcmD family protein [Kofleriaceae bacterium]